MQSGQAAGIDGDGNIVIQVAGSGNVTTITRGPSLTLKPLGKLRSEIRHETDMLKPGCFAIPFVGREQDVADLWKWLRSEQAISVRVLIGRGGSGKTRLGLRLLEDVEAKAPEWQAGFADHEQLRRCSEQPSELSFFWNRPTLIVVDYAATSVPALKDLIRRLGSEAGERRTTPMRILLLERHADSGFGWMSELVDRSWTNDSRAFFDPLEPVKIEALATPDEQRAVLRGTLRAAVRFHPGSACGVPAEGDDSVLDGRLALAEWHDPLMLMMAALTAIDGGWRYAFSLSRTDLAKAIAEREAQRIGRFGSDHDGKLLRHVAAVVTLHGGLSRNLLLDAARVECEALGRAFGGGAGELVDRVVEALPASDGASAVLPDIVGEAFVLGVLCDPAQDGLGTVMRAVGRDTGVVGAVIRMAVDFYGARDANGAEDPRTQHWLDSVFEGLIGAGSPVLDALARGLPESSVALDWVSLRVVQKKLRQWNELEAAPERREAFPAERARLLYESGRLLSALGRPEEAVASAQEAVELRRELAFPTYLALSLNNLVAMLSALGRREEAPACARESVELRRELAARISADCGRASWTATAAARSKKDMRAALPRRGRRPRTDPAPARSRLHPDDGKLLRHPPEPGRSRQRADGIGCLT